MILGNPCESVVCPPKEVVTHRLRTAAQLSLPTYGPIKNIGGESGGDSLAVRSTCCSSTGLRFGSQNLHDSKRTTCNSVSRRPSAFFWAPCTLHTWYTYTCTGKH